MAAEAVVQFPANRFGMGWSIPDFIIDRRLHWLGHVGRMNDERMTKQLLFLELWKKTVCPGTKKRWQDQMAGDHRLKDGWYQLCQNWEAWFASCRDGVNKVVLCRKQNTYTVNS